MSSLAHLSRPGDPNYAFDDGRTASSAAHLFGPLNDEALAEHLLWLVPSDPRQTCQRGLNWAVPPPTTSRGDWTDASDEELRRTLWQTIRTAVEDSAKGASRVAVCLGGIDSSGVLAALCEVRPAASVVAYTYDYDAGADVPFARDLCAAYGVEHSVLRFDDVVPRLANDLLVDGLPYGLFPAGHELQFQERAARDGVDRILTGVYGDDVLGGDPTTLALEALQRPVDVVNFLRKLRTPYQASLSGRIRRMVVGPLLHRALPRAMLEKRVARGLHGRSPWLTEAVYAAAATGVRAAARALLPVATVAELRTELLRGMAQTWAWRTQIVVAGGVSRADPYLFPALVDVASEIPFQRLCLGGQDRGLYRSALPSRVPERVRRRIAKSFMTDDLDRVARLAEVALRPLVGVERLVQKGWIRAHEFRRAFERFGASHPSIHVVLSAEAYLRRMA